MVDSFKFISIHNKFYNLEQLKNLHPGGCLKIFDCLAGEDDCTPLFESAHAMKNIENIRIEMKKFEIGPDEYSKFGITKDIENLKIQNFCFETYHNLAQQVKLVLGENYKVTPFWYLKISVLIFFYSIFYFHGIIKTYEGFSRQFSSFLAGLLWLSIFLCIHHDSSHYALFSTKQKSLFSYQDIISSIFHGWGLWNSYIWAKHHTYKHHSFTGIFGKDPDIVHGRPFFRKSKLDMKVIKIFCKFQDKCPLLVLFFLPGMYLGQTLSYIIGLFRGKVWNININGALSKTPIYEKIVFLASLLTLINCRSFSSVLFYFIGLNINYAISIFPTHDTYESMIENANNTKDWAEMQIRRATNYLNSSKLFTELNGGINQQIEHHLFPVISHCHYRKIIPIIKKFCSQNNIPYIVKEEVFDIYYSYKKMLEYVKLF